MKEIEPQNNLLLQELRMIKSYLALMSIPKRQESWEIFESKYIRTNPRRKMYKLFNGKNSIAQIAKKLKYTSEAVRVFVRELDEANLLDLISIGNVKCPRSIINER